MRLRRFTIFLSALAIVSLLLFFNPPTSSPREQRLHQQIARETAVCPRMSDVLLPGRGVTEAWIACSKTAPVQQDVVLYGVMGGLWLFVLWRHKRKRKHHES